MAQRNFIVFATLALLHVFSRDASGDGGVKVVLTRGCLEYAAAQAVEVLSRNVPDSPLENVQGNADVAVGKVDYEINNARISSFTKPSARVSVNAGQGLTMSLVDGGVSVRGDWRYKFKKGFIRFSDSGSFTASADGISISVSVSLWKNPDGSPSMAARDCRCSMNEANFRLSGGASWLYNLFLRFYKDKIRSFLERLLCREAEKALNRNGVEELATLNLQAAVDDLLVLSYRLTSEVIFADDFVETSHAGRFLNDDDSMVDVPASMSSATNRMFSVSISDATFNSASRVLFKNNKFHFETSFQTDALLDMLQVVTNGTDVSFQTSTIAFSISASHPPKVSLDTGKITLEAEADAKVEIADEQGTRVTAISMKVAVNYQVAVAMVGHRIVGSVVDLTTRLTDCSLPMIDLDKLNEIVSSLMDIMKPSVDEALGVGLPLPKVAGISFHNPIVQLHPRHVTVATDVVYQG